MFESIVKMKAPGDKRPTWLNGVIQLHITRACDLSCCGCTQGSNLAGKPTTITLDQFERMVRSVRDYFGVVGLFGGNPCIHPKFEVICEIFRDYIPFEQRGLWSNNLNGHGKVCRETFNPVYSNLNVHCSMDAYSEMIREWPECHPKGLKDSRHSPPYVALKDIQDLNDEQRWKLIEKCDINQLWSAMVCVFRGEPRGFFCEIAGAQSMLHQDEPDYPDTGLPVVDGWWKRHIFAFQDQIKKHCFECGIPLKGMGSLAFGSVEYVSETHKLIYIPKKPKTVVVVSKLSELNGHVERATDYIENGVNV